MIRGISARRVGVCSRGARGWPAPLFGAIALLLYGAAAQAGLVNVELAPATQTVNLGDTVNVELRAISADGNTQSVGFVGVVLQWDPTALTLVGHNDNGPFLWTSSAFPSESGGLNVDLTDGDAFYLAAATPGGPYANASAAGLLITTLQFSAVQATTGATQVRVVACAGATCTQVADKLPSEGGIDITGVIGPPVDVRVQCQMASDCDDGNPCTDDSCVTNACVSTPNDLNNPNDGLFCNGVEIACDAGTIIVQPGSVPNCDDGLLCTIDSCDEVDDVCVNAPAPATCLIAGTCFNESALNPGNACEWCASAATVTAWTFRPNGSACGNPQNTDCDQSDTCDGLGNCLTNFAASGTACGSAAHTTCTNPDSCDGTGGCLVNNAADMTVCDDGVFCTLTDRCIGGFCIGSDDPCPLRVCDEINGLCKGVDLEWRDALPNPVPIGEVVEVALYVLSNNGTDQAISSVSLVMQWDPARLRLLGKIDNGPYAWLSSSFPNDTALDGLNDTLDDGNGLYQALGRLAPSAPAVATISGLLVTTFRFEALSSTLTSVFMLPQIASTQTKVVDVNPVGLVITGSLGAPAVIQVIDCDQSSDCDDGEFCNGVETCVGGDCVPGVPPDCDDGLFCTGVENCVFGVGCVSPGDPCALAGSCDDVSDTCGGCLTPTVLAEGSRYFAITPQPGVDPIALYVTGDPNDPTVACVAGFLQPTGIIGAYPFYRTPSEWGTIQVTSCAVTPETRYHVLADCAPQVPGLFSAPAAVTTWKWGDVDGNASVTFADLAAVSDASAGNFGSLTISNVDLAPCNPDGVIDGDDVDAALSALAGNPFPCSDPCFGGIPASNCPPDIPATSTWGLVGLMLVLVILGTVRIRRLIHIAGSGP